MLESVFAVEDCPGHWVILRTLTRFHQRDMEPYLHCCQMSSLGCEALCFHVRLFDNLFC